MALQQGHMGLPHYQTDPSFYAQNVPYDPQKPSQIWQAIRYNRR